MEWRLDKQKLQQFRKCKFGDFITCPNKCTINKIPFSLLIYPNGWNKQSAGIVNIYLFTNTNLQSNSIHIKYNLTCIETKTSWIKNIEFNKKNTNHQLDNKLKTHQLTNNNHITFVLTLTQTTNSSHKSSNNNKPKLYVNTNTSIDNQIYSHIPDIIWEFSRNDIQNKLITQSVSSFIRSPSFIVHDLPWKCRCYPNGRQSFYVGDFTLYLDLSSIPNQIFTLQTTISLYIPQTNTRYYKSYTYNRNRQMRSNDNITGDTCLLLPSGYLPIANIYKLHHLTIRLSIDIRRINFTSNHMNCAGIVKLYHPIKLSNNISFKWDVSNEELYQFKNAKFGQYFASENYESWYLTISPNGNSLHKGSNGKVILSLRLIEFPGNFGLITANIILKCNNKYEWKHTAAFKNISNGKECAYCSWENNILSWNKLIEMKYLSFECYINIIAIYDRNGNEVRNQIYKMSISPKKKETFNILKKKKKKKKKKK
eukprot:248337_1